VVHQIIYLLATLVFVMHAKEKS